jgi:nucleotide-binding universal stress UspA family protein
MTYRTILLQLADDARNEPRMRMARDLARDLGGHLVAMHVTPPPFIPVGYGEGAAYIGPEIIEAQREASQVVTKRLREAFERVCEPASGGAEWRHEEGDPGALFAEAARSADLTLAAQTEAHGIDALARQLAEDIVLGAGGPVLVLPREGSLDPSLGKKVLVAWNGGREATRALKDSLGFLARAEAVTVVAAGEEASYRLDGAIAMLGRHGIRADALRLGDEAADDAGGALLRQAEQIGAGMLVMGAYGHSRLREVVMGGATRHVLQAARLPVLMSC